MDINYHYFIIKTLTIKSGFNEYDAQLLASYSQFVDDYDVYAPIYLDNVPEYARNLAEKVPGGWLFYPVTTGFNSWLDNASLILESNQVNITIPFHFIPKQRLNSFQSTRSDWRTQPAKLDTSSLMQEMLIKARSEFLNNRNRKNMIKLGMLIHTFADTYAHQGFSGFWSWENHSWLEKVTNLIDNNDITSDYSPKIYYTFPSVGHVNVFHAPDETFVSFKIQKKSSESSGYDILYSRSNIDEFLKASKEIINYLLSCNGKPSISEDICNNLFVELIKGFKNTSKDINTLSSHWHSIFNDINYSYNKNILLSENFIIADNSSNLENENLKKYFELNKSTLMSVKLTSKSEDYFYYNVNAKEIRDTVNGYDIPLSKIDINIEKFMSEINK